MCYAAIPIIGSVLSTGLQIYGGISEAKAQKKVNKQQQAVAVENAGIAEEEAQYAREQAERNAKDKRREYMQLLGAQRAKMGASGALVDSGSFLDISLSTAEEGERDALELIEQGEREVWRYRKRKSSYMQEAKHYKKQAKNKKSLQLFNTINTGVRAVNSGVQSYFNSPFAQQ